MDPNAPILGYHLEVDRGYPGVPRAGDSVYLPATRHGLAKPIVEHVSWDEDGPNLLLGVWEESEGASLTELTEAGFHTSGTVVADCQQCARTSARAGRGTGRTGRQ